ncbi:hypothetical protein [Dyadobacter sp. CY323]|uniref:hypothetical protein n=1 Tax=Dyadobacter sp. CY323 TaxID=2907302 RepID=UPI001F403AE4|nr:hypothetical protein [Dyadobacter sp. CY323]MCE6987965.1 hypothetical protein [Dyadobacter sp. CY323]
MRIRGKQIIGLFLLSVLLIKVCIIPVIYLDFQLRKDFIVATLCENRNRPQLHCDGKCYLAKKIADAKKQEEKQAESDFLSKLLSAQTSVNGMFFASIFSESIAWDIEMPVKFDYSNALNASDFTRDFFHPPLR